MRGLDLADMLIVLYRSPMKTDRWYLKVLVHYVDICKVNSWLLYRQYANEVSFFKRNQMALFQFASKIAGGKPIDRPAGRPPKRKSLQDITEGKGRLVVTPTPSNCLRTDKTRHWHIFRDKKVNGDFAKKGTVCTSCIKHAFYLCFTIERIAFMNFMLLDYLTERADWPSFVHIVRVSRISLSR